MVQEIKDIETREDIVFLVNTFYDRVLKDELLAPFFLRLNFEEHLPKMVHFWSFILLDEAGYKTDVTAKHLKMPLQKIHFDQWIFLFKETLFENFRGKRTDMALQRAQLVGYTILSKIENQRSYKE